MKKILAGLAVAGLLASAAYGQIHSIHNWTKIEERRVDGQVICTCKCTVGGEIKQTSGYAYCSCL